MHLSSACVQDSLLATPIILDLVILTELCQRITFCTRDDPVFQGFHSVLSLLSFLLKAPLVPQGAPVVNAFFRQRACIENIMRSDTSLCVSFLTAFVCALFNVLVCESAERVSACRLRITCSWSTRWRGASCIQSKTASIIPSSWTERSSTSTAISLENALILTVMRRFNTQSHKTYIVEQNTPRLAICLLLL